MIESYKKSSNSNTDELVEQLQIACHPKKKCEEIFVYSSPFNYNKNVQQDALNFFHDLLIFMAPKSFSDVFKIKVCFIWILFLNAILKIKIIIIFRIFNIMSACHAKSKEK